MSEILKCKNMNEIIDEKIWMIENHSIRKIIQYFVIVCYFLIFIYSCKKYRKSKPHNHPLNYSNSMKMHT